MTLELPPEAGVLLEQQHVMTLATIGPEGPWAAAVFFARHDDGLVFVSAPASRHASDLAADPRCGAAIHAETGDWTTIRGLQLDGRVDELDGPALAAARQAYGERFPFVRGATGALLQALARVRWYRLRVERAYLIDNRRGFGRRQIV